MMASEHPSRCTSRPMRVDGFDGVDEWDGGRWWLPEVLSSPEASVVTAFTFALAAPFGPVTIVGVVADTLVMTPWEPSDFRWRSVPGLVRSGPALRPGRGRFAGSAGVV